MKNAHQWATVLRLGRSTYGAKYISRTRNSRSDDALVALPLWRDIQAGSHMRAGERGRNRQAWSRSRIIYERC